ncbi:MAG: hypothetical protein IPK52_26085 [Chloroflexi bacterium]|nr:hypothetical protein [Chloroflexota bacterium]
MAHIVPICAKTLHRLSAGEKSMKHRQFVQSIARRLPHVERHHVAEVLEVAAELWAEALQQPGAMVTMMNLGKLQVEAQQVKVSGAIRVRLQAHYGGIAPETVGRLYYRFRPAGWLKALVEASYDTQEN